MEKAKICFFYGEEDFLIEQEISKIRNSVLKDGRNISIEYLTPDGIESKHLPEEIFAPSLFGSDRLIVLSGYDEEDYEKLLGRVSEIPEGVTVIIKEENLDKRTKFFRVLRSAAAVKEFKGFSARETDGLVSWIMDRASIRGKKIDQRSAELLIGISGTSLRQLASEIEKLATYTGSKNGISEEDVNAVAVSREIAAFAIENALAARDINGGLKALSSLMRSRERAETILGRIASRIRTYLSIKSLRSGGFSKTEAATRLKMNPYYFERCEKAAGLYSMAELASAISKISGVDMELKTTMKPDELVMQLLLTDILAKETI